MREMFSVLTSPPTTIYVPLALNDFCAARKFIVDELPQKKKKNPQKVLKVTLVQLN